jgi:hypothetical protein
LELFIEPPWLERETRIPESPVPVPTGTTISSQAGKVVGLTGFFTTRRPHSSRLPEEAGPRRLSKKGRRVEESRKSTHYPKGRSTMRIKSGSTPTTRVSLKLPGIMED